MAPTAQGSNDASGIRSNAGSVGSLGMGNMNLESQMYTSTSLMATGNTHHIFDSTPPIQVLLFAISIFCVSLVKNVSRQKMQKSKV